MNWLARIGLWVALSGFGGVAAEDCAWLPAAKVDAALPEFAPWRAHTVGQVSCHFSSERVMPRHALTAERTLHDSPEAARAAAMALKEALSGMFTPDPDPVLGDAGFAGVAEIHGGTLLNVTGHRGPLFVQVKFGSPSGITQPHRIAGLGIADHVLGTAAQMAETENLDQCPHLDVALLASRWPKVRVSLPQEGACAIRAGDEVLAIEIERQTQADDLIQYLIGEDCASEPVPALGASARLAWDCGPEIRVFHAEGKFLVRLELRTGKTPTAGDRAWLASVAVRRAERARGQ